MDNSDIENKLFQSQEYQKPISKIGRFHFEFHITTKSPRTPADNLQPLSTQYLIDELAVTLLDTKAIFCIMSGNPEKRKEDLRNLGRGVLRRLYEEQARYRMGRIPVFRPPPTFVIYLKHLDDRLKQELASLDSKTKDFVMKEAIGRIFEQIDSRYYLLSVKPPSLSVPRHTIFGVKISYPIKVQSKIYW
jgi:hypothetical protein